MAAVTPHTAQILAERASQMRAVATRSEALLWSRLRAKQLAAWRFSAKSSLDATSSTSSRLRCGSSSGHRASRPAHRRRATREAAL